MVPAPFRIRTFALLIDAAFFLALYIPASFIFIGALRREPVWTSVYIGNALLLLIATLEIFAVSPGKFITRLRIASTAGTPAPLSQRLLRYLIKYSPRALGLAAAMLVGISPLTLHVRNALAWSGQAIFRDRPLELTTARIVGELIALALVAGYLATLRPGTRALHDYLSGTQVIRLGKKSRVRGFEPVMAEIIRQPAQSPAAGRIAEVV